MTQLIKNTFILLSQYVQKEQYQGWDLFDGLNSKIFKNSPLYRYPMLRLIWIQLFKRSPINLRVIAKVPKGYNAKGLGLFVTGLIHSGKTKEASALLYQLQQMSCPGYSGKSWGYNFDWQARAFYVPTSKPNMVTTVFVANAFLDYFDVSGERSALDAGVGACEFIMNHLVQFEDKNSLSFAYIPGEETRVHNANMLGATLLARVYSHTGNGEYLEKSRKAMTYSMAALGQDCSWPYGERNHHRFVDNFHTGFNLVALKEWMEYTNDWTWKDKLLGAYEYYLDTFWLESGCPRYYSNSLYPVDIHCSAQGIITCIKLESYHPKSIERAGRIASWAIENMRSPKGYFYFQKTKWFTNRIPYIRWSQAWIFYSLSLYVQHLSKAEIPKEM